MPTLPLILAGPVVRAVAPDAIWVWIATSVDVDVRVDCWPVRTTAPDAWQEDKDAIVHGAWIRPARYGGRLFVALLKALPPRSTSGTGSGLALVGYTLRFRMPQPDRQRGPKRRRADWEAPELPVDLPPEGVALDGDPGLLGTTAVDLAWAGAPGPTVCFANGHLDRVMHSQGSGAADGPDPLVVLDSAIDHALQGDARSSAIPHSIFLVGGQVRAEVPHDTALRLVAALGESLLGLDQRLPDPIPQPLSAARRLRSVEARRTWMKERRVFPSGKPASVAFTFGEYAALHVLRWSPVVWERADSDSGGEIAAAAARAARRLLANVPSYMVLSDMDVAREWNDTSDWRDLLGENPSPRSPWVRQARPGRRVVANGLAAWWAFQGCGNDPEDPAATAIADDVERFLKGADIDPFGSEGSRWDTRWLGERARWWGCRTRTVPPAALLDTRTGRRSASVSIQERTVGPAFLAAVGNDLVAPVLESAKGTRDEVTFVASPDPLFDPVGWGLVQQRLATEVASELLSGAPSDTARVRAELAGMAPGWAWNLPQVLRLLGLLREGKVRPVLLTGSVGGAGASAAVWSDGGAALEARELRVGKNQAGSPRQGAFPTGEVEALWRTLAGVQTDHPGSTEQAVALRLLPSTVAVRLPDSGRGTSLEFLGLQNEGPFRELMGWQSLLGTGRALGLLAQEPGGSPPEVDLFPDARPSRILGQEGGDIADTSPDALGEGSIERLAETAQGIGDMIRRIPETVHQFARLTGLARAEKFLNAFIEAGGQMHPARLASSELRTKSGVESSEPRTETGAQYVDRVTILLDEDYLYELWTGPRPLADIRLGSTTAHELGHWRAHHPEPADQPGAIVEHYKLHVVSAVALALDELEPKGATGEGHGERYESIMRRLVMAMMVVGERPGHLPVEPRRPAGYEGPMVAYLRALIEEDVIKVNETDENRSGRDTDLGGGLPKAPQLPWRMVAARGAAPLTSAEQELLEVADRILSHRQVALRDRPPGTRDAAIAVLMSIADEAYPR